MKSWIDTKQSAIRLFRNSITQCLLFIIVASGFGASAGVVQADQVSIIGKVVPRQSGDIASQISAPISEVFAVGGDDVSKGETLAILNVDDRKADLASAEAKVKVSEAELLVRQAALELEKARLGRLERLKASSSFNAAEFEDSQIEVRRLEAQVLVARAEIEANRAAVERIAIDIERSIVTAPYNAFVVSRSVEVGDYVSAGQPLFSLVSVDRLEVEADIPIPIATSLEEGLAIEALTRDQKKLKTTVRRVIPIENPLTRTRGVRFSLMETDGLAIGQSIELRLSP